MPDSPDTVLAALADPTRRTIFEIVARGDRTVGQLAADVRISQPAASQHLRVLREAQLVRARREGARRYYEADPAGLSSLRAWLERYWDGVLAAFADDSEPLGQPQGAAHSERRTRRATKKVRRKRTR